MNRLRHLLLLLGLCGAILTCESAGVPPVAGSAYSRSGTESALDAIARDTWAYLSSPQTTANHLPYSWWSSSISGGDYANPAEIGFYALSFVALATAVWLAHRAWKEGRWKLLVVVLTVLFLVSCGYAFLWGTWFEPSTLGCAYYGLTITSPLDGSTVRDGTIEVQGTLRGNPPEGSIVVFVRLPGGVLNWPQTAPIEIDPILGVWKGAAALGGDPPMNYHIAIAFVGKSGRAACAVSQDGPGNRPLARH